MGSPIELHSFREVGAPFDIAPLHTDKDAWAREDYQSNVPKGYRPKASMCEWIGYSN
jgi:hypothetical protein